MKIIKWTSKSEIGGANDRYPPFTSHVRGVEAVHIATKIYQRLIERYGLVAPVPFVSAEVAEGSMGDQRAPPFHLLGFHEGNLYQETRKSKPSRNNYFGKQLWI